MNRASLGLCALAAAIGFSPSCGGSTASSDNGDGGSDAFSSSSGGQGSGSGSGGTDAAPTGLAGFAFIVNDVVQHPMTCVSEHWEFPPFPAGTSCDPSPNGPPGCSGVLKAYLVNTGHVPVAYYATNAWSSGYVPGELTGAQYELAGVLSAGAQVNITSVFDGGLTALVGSAEPFSEPDAGYAFDEGSIPWPHGVSGSGGATTMYVALVDVQPSCIRVAQQW